VIGSVIDHSNGMVQVTTMVEVPAEDCFDISIRSHVYYDANGIPILHYTSAALSYSVQEYGRSIVIGSDKSLVTQTEEDYLNVGLDVGVYFGDRKEW